jgi:hypothetical protein
MVTTRRAPSPKIAELHRPLVGDIGDRTNVAASDPGGSIAAVDSDREAVAFGETRTSMRSPGRSRAYRAAPCRPRERAKSDDVLLLVRRDVRRHRR